MVLIASLVAGCGGPQPLTCKDAVNQASATLAKPPDDVTMAIGTCEQQRWSAEQRTCFSQATSDENARTCSGAEPPHAVARSPADDQARAAAMAAAEQANKDAQRAEDLVEKLAKDVDDLSARITDALGKVSEAQSDADRAAASARLQELQRGQAEMRARVEAAKAAAAHAERVKGVHISPECLNNPLAKGC